MQRAWLNRGPLACLLWPLSALFAVLLRCRRWCYEKGLFQSSRLPVPVWVVGNWVVGGAGKTPTVLKLCQWLQSQGLRPGIVSRGYGGTATEVTEVTPESSAQRVGDEPLLLRWRSQHPVFIGRDRVAAARALLQRHPQVNIIVCDDGLQHLSLQRDWQLILFDSRGAGNRWVIPAGPLREPWPQRAPARSIIVYNHDQRSTTWPGCVVQAQLRGAVLWAHWRAGQPAALDALRALNRAPVWAVAGIARPERFFSMLREQGLTLHEIPLPDHHDYASLPWPANASDVLVTEKDAVKLNLDSVGTTRVWVVPLDLHWGDDLHTALTHALTCTWADRAAPLPQHHQPN